LQPKKKIFLQNKTFNQTFVECVCSTFYYTPSSLSLDALQSKAPGTYVMLNCYGNP